MQKGDGIARFTVPVISGYVLKGYVRSSELTHRYAVPMGPINEVFRPSKVYTNSIPGVPYIR